MESDLNDAFNRTMIPADQMANSAQSICCGSPEFEHDDYPDWFFLFGTDEAPTLCVVVRGRADSASARKAYGSRKGLVNRKVAGRTDILQQIVAQIDWIIFAADDS